MSSNSFTLRFNLNKVKYWASRYDLKAIELESELIKGPVKKIRQAGFLNKEQLRNIGIWKGTPRIEHHLVRNTEQDIEEITKIALSTESEYVRIGVLTLLHGIGLPVASAILHLCHKDKYPILDFRALWSLGIKETTLKIQDWDDYTTASRDIAKKAGVDMRTLDRALWQYSKENQ